MEIVHVLKLKQTISFSPCLYRKPSNVVSFFHCHSKELLFLGFLFPAAPILFFFCWNTIPMGLWDHELQKGWWYVLFLALCNMPRQSINIHWINLCHHHSSNCPHVGNQWMTSCKCQNDLLKKIFIAFFSRRPFWKLSCQNLFISKFPCSYFFCVFLSVFLSTLYFS